MAYKVKINGIEVANKNRIVLEIVKQYIKKNPNISYSELTEIFPDNKQGSIGVLKNEEALIAWENDGRNEKREKRFFTESKDVISLNNDKIYVCTEWGDGKTSQNFKPFMEYARNGLGFDIEYIDNVFYGLWISRDTNIEKIIETGIWQNKLSNKSRLDGQINQLEKGDKVFLYQCTEDIQVKNSPFRDFLPKKYEYMLEKNIVKVKSWAIGHILNTNIDDYSVEINWSSDYTPNEWYVYCRQDGVWHFDMDNLANHKKYKALHDIVFNGKTQDYKWWIENKIFDRYKNNKEANTMDSNNTKNIILYGSPGVGKTHNTNKLIRLIEEGKSDREIMHYK